MNLTDSVFTVAGRPTGRPRPGCRPAWWQRLPASEPAQSGAQAGTQPEGTGLKAGPGLALGRSVARGDRSPGRPRPEARPAHGHGLDGDRRTVNGGEDAREGAGIAGEGQNGGEELTLDCVSVLGDGGKERTMTMASSTATGRRGRRRGGRRRLA